MSTTATATRPTRTFAWLGRTADSVARHVAVALGAIIGFQILATVALFFSVNRNGWLTYQGGDQIWLVTSGWLLGKGMIGYALTGHGWPMLLAPLTWITGSSSVQLLPLTTALQVGVLAPAATLAVYDIGARLAGRLAGVWCAAAFAVAPFVAIPYFVQRYHDSWVDQFLPQALGLTAAGRLPLGRRRALARLPSPSARFAPAAHREAVLAGTFAGLALALKPANALFLAASARRARARPPVGAPARSSSSRSLRRSSRSRSGSRGASARCRSSRRARRPGSRRGSATPSMVSATSWLDRTVRLDLDTWRENMSNLREFTWSARVLQFLPLAGALARRAPVGPGCRALPDLAPRLRRGQGRRRRRDRRVRQLLAAHHARRSPRSSSSQPPSHYSSPPSSTGSGRGSHPTPGADRLSTLPRPSSRSSPSSLSPSSCSRPSSTSSRIRTGGTSSPSSSWTRSASRRTRTSSRSPSAASVTPTSSGGPTPPRVPAPSTACTGAPSRAASPRWSARLAGSDRCDLRAETLVTTRDHTFVDRDPPADAIYRIGVAANWLDDETRGDVVAISPPVAPPASSG